MSCYWNLMRMAAERDEEQKRMTCGDLEKRTNRCRADKKGRLCKNVPIKECKLWT
jgi:hypothetical protein